MRIATLIIGIFVSGIMFLQSCAGLVFGNIAQNADDSGVFSGGVVVAFTSVVAVAFVLRLPLVSTIAYLLAAILAFGISGNYDDMGVYGVLLVILAIMSFVGWLGLRKEKKDKLTSS